MDTLRLFPLRTVLFPDMELPLVVFEDRYKQLVAECVEQGEAFGVALIKEGDEVGGEAVPYPLGTTARIRSVSPLGGARLRVTAVGERRFRVIELHHDRPYLHADVEYPVDESAEAPADLLREARERYVQVMRLRLTSTGEYRREVTTPDAPGALADLIGGLQAAPVEELQRLLETMNVRQRLDRASELLDEALSAAHRQAAAAVAERFGSTASLN